jgi:hypothetical protein
MLYKDEILQALHQDLPKTGFNWINLDYESKTVQDVILIDIKQFYPTIILNALENNLIDNTPKINLEDTKNNLRWFLENKQLIKSQSETLYKNWLTRVNTLYHKLKTPIPLIYSELLYNDIISNNKDIIYINVDMIVLLNNNQIVLNQIVLDKLSQLYKDVNLNQNEFVSVNKLDWFLVKEKHQYIYKLDNVIKYPNIIKDNELNSLKTQITEDIRTIKLNKLFNN